MLCFLLCRRHGAARKLAQALTLYASSSVLYSRCNEIVTNGERHWLSTRISLLFNFVLLVPRSFLVNLGSFSAAEAAKVFFILYSSHGALMIVDDL